GARRLRDLRQRHAELSGTGRPTTRGGLGAADCRCPHVYPVRAVDGAVPSAGDRLAGDRGQPGLRGSSAAGWFAPMSVLQVEEFSVAYGDAPAVHALSFSIDRREAYGLVGESGSGKSTVA